MRNDMGGAEPPSRGTGTITSALGFAPRPLTDLLLVLQFCITDPSSTTIHQGMRRRPCDVMLLCVAPRAKIIPHIPVSQPLVVDKLPGQLSAEAKVLG